MNLAIRDDSNAYDNESSAVAARWPPYRSYDVIMYDIIAGHENIYVNNSSQNRGRAVAEVSLCLSRQDASNDMQYDLPGSFIRSGHLTDLRSNFQIELSGSRCLHMFRCVLTRGMRWCLRFSLCSMLSSKVICKKADLLKSNIFSFTYPGKVKMWPKVINSGMVIFKTSQPFRLFLFRSSISIGGQTSRGWRGRGGNPGVRSRMAK